MKSVLVDFLIGAGIKPISIVSMNHLGNNVSYQRADRVVESFFTSCSHVFCPSLFSSLSISFQDGKK